MQIRTPGATDRIPTREEDIAYIMECIADVECCSIVGVSNIGKSVLLRSVCRPEVRQRCLGRQADDYAFVYIDFNLMLEMTEQGFYELVLRNILAELAKLEVDQGLLDRLNESYRSVVNPTNQFMVPLSFNEGMISINEGLGRRVVLLFDEFQAKADELDCNIDILLQEGREELAIAAQSKLNSTQRLADEYREQHERQRAEYEKLLDAKLKLEAKLTTIKQEREELQALLDLAKAKELTAKAISSLDDLVGAGDDDIGRLAESIRTRLDKASARGEMAATRLDAQMDEVLERTTIDAQLAERKKRLGIGE